MVAGGTPLPAVVLVHVFGHVVQLVRVRAASWFRDIAQPVVYCYGAAHPLWMTKAVARCAVEGGFERPKLSDLVVPGGDGGYDRTPFIEIVEAATSKFQHVAD